MCLWIDMAHANIATVTDAARGIEVTYGRSVTVAREIRTVQLSCVSSYIAYRRIRRPITQTRVRRLGVVPASEQYWEYNVLQVHGCSERPSL
jgi:hypothetical protein